ncbi:MAG: M14 family metallopeptidase [Flavobacteriaceae bacterium]|nr:M14 family metallopeptidase [Flavobacteriaceae bacterium]
MQNKHLFLYIVVFLSCLSCDRMSSTKNPDDFPLVFEQSEGKQTATYQEVIDFYTRLAKNSSTVSLQTMGETDSGLPLHIVTINADKEFNFKKIREKKAILLINNGIHPGESDGIDASMMLFRDMAMGTLRIPENVCIVSIPVYNIGGALNRNSHSRTNQNGPEAYGFRGNAKNFDLNRDFVKTDTQNALSFTEILHLVKPDVFIDTHVSNGADYQYTLTHLWTQHNKLGGSLGPYLKNQMIPNLEKKLLEKKWDITPYVNVFGTTPDQGFSQFFDSPRYSTGYTSLFHILGMMVETHMLKPYKSRVEGTYDLLNSMIDLVEEDFQNIKQLRTESIQHFLHSRIYPLKWEIDTTKWSELQFKGFEAKKVPSPVTGLQRLQYDKTKPYTKNIIYKDYFKPSYTVEIPKAYIVKKEYKEIILRLKLNQIQFETIEKDSTILVEKYRILSYDTSKKAYEGHYIHYNTKVKANIDSLQLKAGDLYIPTQQEGIRYLLETLEPEASDSFFNWNYFDPILQQKEHFSAYVFEDKALQILKERPELKKEFDSIKRSNPKFSKNAYAQLDWIHKHSAHYEKAHLQYPVYRVLH